MGELLFKAHSSVKSRQMRGFINWVGVRDTPKIKNGFKMAYFKPVIALRFMRKLVKFL